MITLMCYFIMFILILLFSISSSFIFCWMLMESSTLVFLSLICLQNMNQKFMAISSYFLIQVFSSSIFLLSMSMMYNMTLYSMIGTFFYNVSLSMKIGLFPFFKWVINLVYSMNWMSIGLLSTYQKFMPMMMLSLNFWHNYYLIISFFSMLMSMYYSLGLYSVKLIFSYSILSHSSWNTIMLSSMNWWLIYYLLYSLLFMMICLLNYYFNIEDLSDFMYLYNSSKLVLMIYLLNLISLSGMPPFTGFLIKFFLINYFFNVLFYIYLMFFILTSLIHFYLYIRIMLLSFSLFMGKSKHLINYMWNNQLNLNLIYFFTFIVNFFMLFLGLKMII
uniref:NADH-ubiquinone oxidoreductase chain 2 n=1 Tax=Auplopus sp. SJW-2017 TaxID=1940101 RepID=A0A1P8VH85_9HYME|nr:NADH dehydrogenase subunit 2 [Auplopus sp. SJW-2017]